MVKPPYTIGFFKGENLLLVQLLEQVRLNIDNFTWHRNGTDTYFGESKIPCSVKFGVKFHYIVGLIWDREKKEYRFIVSHDKYYIENHLFSVDISADMPEFSVMEKLRQALLSRNAMAIERFLQHNVFDKTHPPASGLHNFLSSLKQEKELV